MDPYEFVDPEDPNQSNPKEATASPQRRIGAVATKCIKRPASGFSPSQGARRQKNGKDRKQATAAKNKFLQSPALAALQHAAAPAPEQSAAEGDRGEEPGEGMLSPSVLMRMVHARRAATIRRANDQAPATSIMEAQEKGEELQAVDDASYALEGLVGECGAAVRKESAAALARLCATRRALMSEGMVPEVLCSFQASIAQHQDPDVVLCAAAVVLGAALPHADPAIIRMPEAMSLVKTVLSLEGHGRGTNRPDGPSEVAASLLSEGPLARALGEAAEPFPNPAAIALTALSDATDPHSEHRAADEALKAALRESGILAAVAHIASRAVRAFSSGTKAPGAEAPCSKSLAVFQRSMQVIEHATFCCSENVKLLSGISCARAGGPASGSGGAKCTFPELAAEAFKALCRREDGDTDLFQPTLRAMLAALMNLTHSNPSGVRLVSECGLCEVLAEYLRGSCEGPSAGSARHRVLQRVEVVSLALGLLINLVEGHQPNKPRLLLWPGGILEMLSRIMALSSSRPAGDDGGAPEPNIECEVTADDLESDELEGKASIVEVYAAMLLGFMVSSDAGLRSKAAELLPHGSFEPVVSAIERCLQFHTQTDTITDATGTKLRNLIECLKD